MITRFCDKNITFSKPSNCLKFIASLYIILHSRLLGNLTFRNYSSFLVKEPHFPTLFVKNMPQSFLEKSNISIHLKYHKIDKSLLKTIVRS